jgi:acetoin utilization deacetylase AcuC-like enzyme
MKKFAVIYDEIFLKHNPGTFHPESPQRVEAIWERLQKEDIAPYIEVFPPDTAKKGEILWNHSECLYNLIEHTKGKPYTQLDPDTATNEYSFFSALKAVGAQKTALKLLFEEGYKGAFSLVRPPGHHAEKDCAMGFCLFNNIAIAAYYAKNYYGLKKILIIDWDLHHGNGTQKSFYSDPEVLYFSVHQYPYYPGTGHYSEIGEGKGIGFTLNVPLPAYCGDEEYIYIFKEFLEPIALQFKPEIIMVSAGFDFCEGDPLGNMEVTPHFGIPILTLILKNIAEKTCQGRTLFTLEGGYNAVNLQEGVANLILTFLGLKDLPEKINFSERAERIEAKILKPLKELLRYATSWLI